MSEITEVKYNHLGNDLFWSVYHHKGDHFERVSWSGYNDGFWWNNVANTDQFKVSKCKCGQEFELDPHSHEVKELATPSTQAKGGKKDE